MKYSRFVWGYGDMKLIVENVSKSIKRRKILDNISMEMESGNIYGICGRNGSGKTMLFRALSGLMRLDAGRVIWDGRELHRDFAILPKLGIVLEHTGLHPSMTGKKNLLFLASLTKTIGQKEVCETMRRVGLDANDKRTYGKYSMGMKQRMAIAQAVMERPDIIFLDGPTYGLDEAGIRDIRNLIAEEKERGALILLASHNRDDVDILADTVYHISDGKIVKGRIMEEDGQC